MRHAPAAHYPRERPGTHSIGGWVGPRVGLDRSGKSRPHRDSIPRPLSPQPVTILTELPGPLIKLRVLQNAWQAQELLISAFQKGLAVISYMYDALTAHLLTPLTRTTVDCPETKLNIFGDASLTKHTQKKKTESCFVAKLRVKTVYPGARNLHCLWAHIDVNEIDLHIQYVNFSWQKNT